MTLKRPDPKYTKSALVLAGIAAGAFTIGFATARSTNAASDPAPPAYMVVSSKLLKPDAIAAYREAAGPLANAAGLEILARATHDQLLTLEGEFPFQDGITIERFRSMRELRDFWFSDAYQQAKKLREGVAHINFIVAFEGMPLPGSPD